MLLAAWVFITVPVPCAQAPAFHPPVRVTAGVRPLRVAESGHAAPAWGDLDLDGKPDLIVGQFAGASMRVLRHINGSAFTTGDPVRAAGQIAIVPDIA
ncbi:MAG TPA: hypothetical protein VFZ65_08095 [Planctomycetota bacterium]|nr:hypothetical protein [Planctomycetota bacterium]